MERQRPRVWTQNAFEKPNFQNHSNFDDSGIQTDVIQSLERRIPNHFLVIALVKQLCSFYIEDEDKCSETFNALCEQLARMKILPTFALHEDFSAVREKYITAFHDVLVTAAGANDSSLKKIPVRPGKASLVPRCNIPSELLETQRLLSYNTSRYKEEFQELEKLGKGGFGSVYKVKNRLDSREYAVKKVHLSEKDLPNCLKVIREVKVLARLRHPNVVGYQSAWLEFVNSENAMSNIPRISTHPGRLMDLTDSQPNISNILHRVDSQESEDSRIIFQTSDTSFDGDGSAGQSETVASPPTSPVRLKGSWLNSRSSLMSTSNLGIQRSASDANLERFTCSKSYKKSHLHLHIPNNVKKGYNHSKESDSSNTGESISTKGFGIVLFIQMELCDITLGQWLFERNRDLPKNGGQVNKKKNMEIFKQIVVGVNYIHSQGLIHRDLKPSNIFLHRDKRFDGSYEYRVKIGDFGLARTDLFRQDPPHGAEFTSMIEPLSPLFPPGSPTSTSPHSQTLGVGTCTYAAPEQLHNKAYCSRVDIYSLGIILFEFFKPFNTEMERHTCIKDLRKGDVPQEFRDLWPEQADLILRMMTADPKLRPSADEIVSMNIVSEKNKCFAELLTKLESEQKEKEFLREKVRNLELELRKKDELVAQLRSEQKRNCDLCGKLTF